MSYFLDQKKKFMQGQPSKYNIQDDSDERVFKDGTDDYGHQTQDAFEAQKRLNDKWAGT